MSDDLNKKIMQIADILGQEGMPDNIKGLLSLLSASGNSGSKEDVPARQTDVPVRKEEKPSRPDMDESLEMIRKVKTLMDRTSTSNDPRLNLITAIKPFLNSKRQQKLSNCMMLLQMSRLTRFMGDTEKSKD
ncbi:MAG: hypothetical protein N2484_09365 [Clostridia bacterium]|nr:hypothetical protein [Clostridia bacterium]